MFFQVATPAARFETLFINRNIGETKTTRQNESKYNNAWKTE